MATAGLTTIGGSNNSVGGGFSVQMEVTIGAIAGTLNNCQIYGRGGSTHNIKTVVYESTASPVNQVAAASDFSITTTNGWAVGTLAGEAVSASTNYYAGVSTQSANVFLFYNNATGNRAVGSMATTPQDPWTISAGVFTGRVYSMYIDYTESSSGTTVILTQPSETDSAQAIAVVAGATSLALNQLVESDSAQTISPSIGALIQAVSQTTELNQSQLITAVSGAAVIALSQALETDTAQNIAFSAGATIQSVAQTFEGDSAEQINPSLGVSAQIINQVSETDLSQSITTFEGGVSVSVSQAFESDTAFIISLGTGGAASLLNQAIETDLSQGILVAVSAVSQTVTQAVESDVANIITFTAGSTLIPVGSAFEVNQSNPINTFVGGAVITINQVFETDIAFSVSVPTLTIGGIYNASEYFATGLSVTIELYNPVDGLAVTLSDTNCVEIASTGLYVWDSSKLAVQPIGYQEYVWKMTDGIRFEGGVLNMFDATDSVKLDAMFNMMNDVENGLTQQQAMRIILAAAAGVASGAGTGTISFNDNANVKPRITAAVDGIGNRTSVTLDAT
jgi:hypothetical protein